MKAIHANPITLKRLFKDSIFTIPDYQRPYSWDQEQCEKLWEDITLFYDDNKIAQDGYFLGNIVLYKKKDNAGETSYVVDGQQRLITLSLLMRALFDKARVYRALEESLFIFDEITGENTNRIKICSNVIDDEKNALEDVLICGEKHRSKSNRYSRNYSLFVDMTTARFANTNSSGNIEDFIQTILDRILLLPIECGDMDDALTIFETINNRGLSLSDIDIFKAKIHKKAGANSEKFIEKWNLIAEDIGSNIEEKEKWKSTLFRIYMHVLRAKEKDVSKEIGMRAFFKDAYFSDWEQVISDLEKLDTICYYLTDTTGEDEEPFPFEILRWLQVLEYYPNKYWEYPVSVFLYKNYESFANDEPIFLNNFEQLLIDTVRYCYWKSLVHNSVNVVKDDIFKVCAAIWSGDDYNSIYKAGISRDKVDIKALLDVDTRRITKGLCFIHAYINLKQKKLILGKREVEHILPRSWANYDGWSEEEYSRNLDRLGNLMILEKKLNIKATNEYFIKKHTFYKDSVNEEAKTLVQLDRWYPEEFHKRQQKVIKDLVNFFTEVE